MDWITENIAIGNYLDAENPRVAPGARHSV